MSTIYDVKASDLVGSTAEKLKGLISKPPEYISVAKSSSNRDRPPSSPDFWYMRSASILRQVYLNGPIGVSRLRTRYGGRKQHVVHRQHRARAGGSLITDSLRELEKAKLVKRSKLGREITPQGRSMLDKISTELSKSRA